MSASLIRFSGLLFAGFILSATKVGLLGQILLLVFFLFLLIFPLNFSTSILNFSSQSSGVLLLSLVDKALNETPSQSYWMSLAIWGSHMPPDTSEHQPEAGIRFTDPGGMEG